MSLHGVDISSHQGNIDLSALTIDFCIIKATEACSYVNPFFKSKYEQAKSLGILRGLYHFASGQHTGKEEADFFLSHVNDYVGDSILVLDWEGQAEYSGVEYAKEFLDRVFERTGVKAMIYLNRNCVDKYNWFDVVSSDYGVWLATLDGSIFHSYRECSLVAMVQTCAKPITGYPRDIDCNVFFGDRETWLKYQKAKQNVTMTAMKCHVGQKVRFSTCYKSSTDGIEKHIPASKMLRDTGVITDIRKNVHNPYLLDNGLCWVNDGDIREVL